MSLYLNNYFNSNNLKQFLKEKELLITHHLYDLIEKMNIK